MPQFAGMLPRYCAPPPYPSSAHKSVGLSPMVEVATAGADSRSAAAVGVVVSQQRRRLRSSPAPSTSMALSPSVTTAHALDGSPSGVRASRMAVKVRWWMPLFRNA